MQVAAFTHNVLSSLSGPTKQSECKEKYSVFYWHYSHTMLSRVYETIGSPSVGNLSVCMGHSSKPWAPSSAAFSSKCDQCHVEIRGTRINSDLFKLFGVALALHCPRASSLNRLKLSYTTACALCESEMLWRRRQVTVISYHHSASSSSLVSWLHLCLLLNSVA